MNDEVIIFRCGFDDCCGAPVDVLGTAAHGQSFVVALGRCHACEDHQWSVRLGPSTPFISAVAREIEITRSRILAALYA